MDTDSILVPIEVSSKVINYFKPLNPYSSDIALLKKEKEDVCFYGICSKRYCLYNFKNKKIELMDYKLHGLGHLINPWSNKKDWHKDVWLDILNLHYNYITSAEIYEKYSVVYGISRFTVSTPHLIKRFNTINNDRPYEEQIKPSNFFYLGFSVNKNNSVKPLVPFGGNPQKLVYDEFIDYNTGKVMQGCEYWKPLGNTILEYIDHSEYKLDGGIGQLERKHIVCNDIQYIGKEANNIDEEAISSFKPIEYKNNNQFKKDLRSLNNKELMQKYHFKTRSHIKYWRDKLF
ncbi:hypothetical protein GW835_01025 [archaeon]|nr:hypothetical protein [archaeon]NCP79136.1 hypothetical protein [archaeon]NCP97918.1 hypothetical protein [archaeon]NCQ06903.1 hypothetical protein [archaeon]NCQ50699.1 hypothetical protein [archaeon]